MKSEIIQELEENVNKMTGLIESQVFTVKDAQQFLERYLNILRKMEQLTASRDIWKAKYSKLKNENQNNK